jgi:hypothetical protein
MKRFTLDALHAPLDFDAARERLTLALNTPPVRKAAPVCPEPEPVAPEAPAERPWQDFGLMWAHMVAFKARHPLAIFQARSFESGTAPTIGWYAVIIGAGLQCTWVIALEWAYATDKSLPADVRNLWRTSAGRFDIARILSAMGPKT